MKIEITLQPDQDLYDRLDALKALARISLGYSASPIVSILDILDEEFRRTTKYNDEEPTLRLLGGSGNYDADQIMLMATTARCVIGVIRDRLLTDE